MLGTLKFLPVIALVGFNSAYGSVFPGKCPFVPPSVPFNPNEVVGEWNILRTTDLVLKHDSKCAHSRISAIDEGLLIQFSNHFKNGSIHDYNITLNRKVTPATGYYTTLAMNPDLDLTVVTFYVAKDYFMVWICATLSPEENMEQMYIDGPSADIPEEVIQTFFNHLSAHGSNVKRETLFQLPEITCHHD